MEGNILSIAGGVSDNLLLLQKPRDHPSAEGVAVATNGLASVRAICVVGVRVTN